MNAPQNWPQQPQQPPQPGRGGAGAGAPGQAGPGYGAPGQGGPAFGAPGQSGPGYGGPPYGPPGQGHGPGYGPRPPGKSRAGLVVGILAGVVLLVVAGIFGSMYLEYTEDVGYGPGDQPTEACAISDSLKQQAKTSSFHLAITPHDGKTGLKHSLCMWEQAKGKDGRNPRKLSIHVYDYRVFNKDQAKNREQAENTYGSQVQLPGGQAKPIDGLGDEATFVKPSATSDKTHVALVLRKGEVVYQIEYFGRDKGFLSDREFPVADAEAVARKAAEEMAAK